MNHLILGLLSFLILIIVSKNMLENWPIIKSFVVPFRTKN
jgi:hypothetical protein